MATQSRPPVILLTRTAAQSARFAEALKSRWPGIRIVHAPLIVPRFLTPDLPDRAATAIILTSETGAQAARRITADGAVLPSRAFCVGDRTADAAREAGFEPLSAQGDADALISLILSRRPESPLLYLRGRDSRGDIAERLALAGIETLEAITYAQEGQPLTGEADLVLQGKSPVIAPIFSPRTAELLAQEFHRLGLTRTMTVIAMSPAVAAAAKSLSGILTIAARPSADAMVDAISPLLELWRKP